MSSDMTCGRSYLDQARNALLLGVWLFGSMWSAGPGLLLAQDLSESEVKAGFVYNFTRYVEWPADSIKATGPFRLCVTGPSNDLARRLEALNEKGLVQGRPMVVMRATSIVESRPCHALVFSNPDRIGTEWIRSLADRPILTIGQAPNFAASGGMIGLVVEADKVRFEANIDATQKAGLKLSSQLLKLARIVKSEN